MKKTGKKKLKTIIGKDIKKNKKNININEINKKN